MRCVCPEPVLAKRSARFSQEKDVADSSSVVWCFFFFLLASPVVEHDEVDVLDLQLLEACGDGLLGEVVAHHLARDHRHHEDLLPRDVEQLGRVLHRRTRAPLIAVAQGVVQRPAAVLEVE